MNTTDADYVSQEFDELKRKIGHLHFRQLLIKHEAQERIRNRAWVEGKWSPIYRSPYDGEKKKYGAHGIEGEAEYRAILSEQQNAMYRWLIVDCYEIFEKYLKALRQYILANKVIGKTENYIRLCEECGDKLGRKSKFYELISSLHQSQDFKNILSEVRIDVDLDVAILVLSEFRNIIVHGAGKLSDFNGFIDKVMKKASWSGEAKRVRVHDFSCKFVTTEKSLLLPENLIFLEMPVEGSRIPGHHFDLYQELSGCFVGYAELVRDCILGRLKRTG